MGIGLPDELSSLSPQNFSLKTFIYFLLKRPALTDFLISAQKIKVIFSYILKNGNPSHISGENFRARKTKKKKRKERKKEINVPKTFLILYFRKWNFLATSFKNFLYFRKELVKAENKKFRHIFCLLREVLKHKHKRFLILFLKKLSELKYFLMIIIKRFFPFYFFIFNQLLFHLCLFLLWKHFDTFHEIFSAVSLYFLASI